MICHSVTSYNTGKSHADEVDSTGNCLRKNDKKQWKPKERIRVFFRKSISSNYPRTQGVLDVYIGMNSWKQVKGCLPIKSPVIIMIMIMIKSIF